ncbi:MAG: sensor histidine kinase [Curvibacter lanceolatus]|jgi:signal transduction histidine kinase|uniref:sensor histidine kinase n=1 Tax=Curvibacter lanceolatus TaxID=86182 RepID=UPI0003689164|nr:ATP-binding protein [Curvibacter lanceolatus]MBV5295551.1 sensor histidine kinase [Curvibacter lanceolatus]
MSEATATPTPRNAPLTPSILMRGFTGSRLSWMVALSVLALLSIGWVVVVLTLDLKARDAVAAEVRQNTNLARVLQEQTVRVLASVDQATLRMRDAAVAGELTPADYGRIANETGLVPQILTQLSLVDAQGRFVGSNIDPTGEKTGHVDLSSREHVQVHLASDKVPDASRQMSLDGLFIGKPVLGKVSNKWTIQLSRKIERSDGRILGVVVASLNPAYFEQSYGEVNLGPQGGVTLLGNDRSVRARVIGGTPTGMGTTLSNNSTMARLPQNERAGWSIVTSNIDKIERVAAYHRVADYPLRVYVLTSTEGALSDWRSLRNVAVTLMSLLTLASLVGAGVFLRGLRQLENKNHALQISEAQAQSASRAKSEFLAAVSHELRTPLTSIRGFAELMEMRLEQPRFKEQARMIRKAAEHLNELLTEILDLAKVEAGAMPVTPEAVALTELLQSTLDFFSVTAAQKSLDLKLQLAPSTPQTLLCDGLRLKQILNNLLSNALKFTQQGSVTIEVDGSDDMVSFHVVDTGPGIAPELHDTIFERFRQGNDRVSYEHGGTGLGLSLSRALAGLMGGTLTVQSSPGQGARFTLSLPRPALPQTAA